VQVRIVRVGDGDHEFWVPDALLLFAQSNSRRVFGPEIADTRKAEARSAAYVGNSDRKPSLAGHDLMS
jgi:hypothetical protein